MDDDTSTAEAFANRYSIKDPLNIILTMLIAFLFGMASYYINIDYLQYDRAISFPALVNGLFFMVALRLSAVWHGIQFDFNHQTIEFPGGQISANSVLDYINPFFILQFFGRKRISLDRISQIGQKSRWGHRVFGFKINQNKLYYGLNIIGNFGGATIWFVSEDKCEEAYSAIRQINHMGTPINRA
jgi:hypothetical protein